MKTADRTYQVGRLNKRLTLQSYSTTPDGMGGTTATWADLVTVWADITPKSGKERAQLGNLQSNITHEITVRYREDLVSQGYSDATYDHELRAKFGSRVFNIKYVYDRGEEQSYMKMLAVEES